MEKILGIDLGTNSIGWAIREINNDLENQIIDKGVLTFDKGVAEDKSGEHPMVQKRTEARGKRRNYQAEKYRKWELLECLINEGMCPLTIEELNEWRHYKKGFGRRYPQSEKFIQWLRFDFDGDGKPDFERFGLSKHDNCYAFRWLAVSNIGEHKKYFEDNKQLLGRVFYQMVQRRGFKSASEDDAETNLIENGRANVSDVNKIEVVGIKVIDKLISDKYKTLGAALFMGQKNNELEAINHNRIRNRFTYRHHFENEIESIFLNLGYDLESDFCLKIKKTIIWQRPLRSQKGLVGFCTLDRPLKSKTGNYYKAGKKRLPVSHPLYEEFRTWVDINNLKIEPPKGIEKKSFLEDVIFPMFNKASDFTYKAKKDKSGKLIDKGIEARIIEAGAKILSKFDVELDEENEGKKYKANTFLYKVERIFGKDWKQILHWDETLNGIDKTGKYLRIEDIWHLVYDATITKSQTDKLGERLVPILEKHFPENEFKVKDFDGIRLDKGYASLSKLSIKKILPFLKQGMLYSHAVFIANLESVFEQKLDKGFIEQLRKEYSDIIKKYKEDKEIYLIVNGLISDTLNEFSRINMGNNYVLDEFDLKDINNKIKDSFNSKVWNKKGQEQQNQFVEDVKILYQSYLRQPRGIDRSKQFFKIYRIEQKIIELLNNKYNITLKTINKYLWHPSEQEVYSPANIKADKDGVLFTNDRGNEILFLGDPNPISRGFKNPMAMKTLQYLKKHLNYLLEVGKINENTKVVVEIARELNDTNTRKAIKKYQDERKKLRDKYKKEIAEYYDSKEETNKIVSDEMLERYELWQEQTKKCLYCNKNIECAEVFNGTAEIEHTIPESISRCSELFNKTLAHSLCNGRKAKRFPTQWAENYDLIENNIKFMYAKYMVFKEKHESTYAGEKTTTKEGKDKQIQDRHYFKLHLTYWKKKYETFVIEEVTNQFRRQQLTDTQIITKYALPFLKTVFKRVDVQKGIDTSLFRKIYQIEPRKDKKDRTVHSHHAIDAAVLTLIPPSSIKEFLRKEYHIAHENGTLNSFKFPNPRNWENYKSEYIRQIEDDVLINFQPQFRTTTQSVKYERKRGEKVPLIIDKKPIYKNDNEGNILYKKNNKGEFEFKRNHLGDLLKNDQGDYIPIPLKEFRKAQGQTIRGQLHQESIFGAILKPQYDENNKAINVKGKFLFEDKISYVKRSHLEINTLRGFKYDKKEKDLVKFIKQFEDIIDPYVKEIVITNIKKRLDNGIDPEQVLVEPIFMLNSEGKQVHQIRRVRLFQGNINPPEIKKVEATFISQHKHKQFTYAANTDYVSMVCYKGIDENKNEMYHFKPYTTLGLSKEREIPKFEFQDGVSYNLNWELKPGMKILLKKDTKENLIELDKIELNKRLYKINSVFPQANNTGKLYYYSIIHFHLNVISSEIKNPPASGKINFDKPKANPLVRLNLANSSFLIEGKHFEIKLDGKINWLF